MFLENTINHAKQSGWMEVICGSMFSGKTERIDTQSTSVLKWQDKKWKFLNQKWTLGMTMWKWFSHNHNKIMSTPVESSNEILLLGSTCDVIGIDEAQFFDEGIVRSS